MIKKTIEPLLIAILLYAMFSFMTAELDFRQWVWIVRFTYIIILLFAITINIQYNHNNGKARP